MRDNVINKVLIFVIVIFVITAFIFLGYTFSYDTNNSYYSDKTSYTATFDINGATYLEKKKLSCLVENGVCLITLPTALRDNGEVLGYNTFKNANSVIYHINQQVNLTEDATFYVISKDDLFLEIIDDDIDYLGSYQNYCTIYNEEASCKILMPFYNKVGYEVRGYSTSKLSLAGFIYPMMEYEIKRDTTLYPIYSSLTRGKVIDVSKTTSVGNSLFDIEKGCQVVVYNKYLNYFEKILKNAPYLMIGSKVTFLTDETFDKIWGDNYVGMNYGPKGLKMFDIRCSNDIINNYYATIVHELAHTWDFYYSNFTGNDITSQSDVVNLYNKYKNMSKRPFRDYSYTDIREFFADMVRYYYLKYTDPSSGYKNLSYPSDCKKVLEKYICIANNNYDKNACNNFSD